jgi:LL-diaminopimelate aminotransferase
MLVAKRLQYINEYYFSKKLREIDVMNKAGKQVINLGIGSPDLPPHPDVIKVLQEECAKPNVHAYQSYKGSPVFRNAVAQWYHEWYNVELDANTEILPLLGSKEGIMHICMTYLNEGDLVLVPNPGYPTYTAAATICGAKIAHYELEEKSNWLPDFTALRETVKTNEGRPVLMFVNYPHMPTGTLPTKDFFEKLVAFARANNVLIIHDNPYSFILNDSPMSLLSVEGAKDVVLELNSLSKSLNMAGWRIGMLCGAEERIEEVLRFKSNMDSGMFLPLQLAAAKALSLDKSWYNSLNAVYSSRREKVFSLLDILGCIYDSNQVGMFVWAKVPAVYKDGYSLSDEVLSKSNVFITPGGIFGSAGESYIRVSLCAPQEKFEEAIIRIAAVIPQVL